MVPLLESAVNFLEDNETLNSFFSNLSFMPLNEPRISEGSHPFGFLYENTEIMSNLYNLIRTHTGLNEISENALYGVVNPIFAQYLQGSVLLDGEPWLAIDEVLPIAIEGFPPTLLLVLQFITCHWAHSSPTTLIDFLLNFKLYFSQTSVLVGQVSPFFHLSMLLHNFTPTVPNELYTVPMTFYIGGETIHEIGNTRLLTIHNYILNFFITLQNDQSLQHSLLQTTQDIIAGRITTFDHLGHNSLILQ